MAKVISLFENIEKKLLDKLEDYYDIYLRQPYSHEEDGKDYEEYIKILEERDKILTGNGLSLEFDIFCRLYNLRSRYNRLFTDDKDIPCRLKDSLDTIIDKTIKSQEEQEEYIEIESIREARENAKFNRSFCIGDSITLGGILHDQNEQEAIDVNLLAKAEKINSLVERLSAIKAKETPVATS